MPGDAPPHDPAPRAETWAALLTACTHFARSAAALPTTGEPGRFRKAVPSLIALQALYHALQHLHELPPQELHVGQDMAAVLLRAHEAELRAIWLNQPLPKGILEILQDTTHALELARRPPPAAYKKS